ncbi:unnamed protein product, partial [Didymodactylos carnosus]
IDELTKKISHAQNELEKLRNEENRLQNMALEIENLYENINTISYLRTISNDHWDKLNKLTHVVKQLIRDYLQLNTESNIFNQNITDPYRESKATLFGDIHRVRRYFYYVTKHLHLLSYLDRRTVDLAISEVRKSYDDDGNALINIQNYLRTFCLQNIMDNAETIKRKQLKETVRKQQPVLHDCEETFKLHQEHYQLVTKEVNRELSNGTNTRNIFKKIRRWIKSLDDTNNKKSKYRKECESQKAAEELQISEHKLILRRNIYLDLTTKIQNNRSQIENLEKFLNLNLEEEHKKLIVKYGRGLLLYGPPGTGKSELLKRVAVYAGITMVTQPLAAGELNRPYIGETEKLLIDIMCRANTIPYLICAMTIDEIDGLVPKRDNNAQQSKVDGISVLLSHIIR